MKRTLFTSFLCVTIIGHVFPQEEGVLVLNLEDALSIAFQNQPLIAQFENQVEITKYEVKSAGAGWLPQVRLGGELNRYFQQPVAIFPDFDDPESGEFQEVRTGVPHNANLNVNLQQNLLNNELFRASAQKSSLLKAPLQNYEDFKIQLVVGLSKTFYEVLLAEEQVRLTQEDLKRQNKQLEDTKLQYEAGITDNIDYKRATITLQNTRSLLYQYKELVKTKTTELKYWMGLEAPTIIEVQADTDDLEEGLSIDTLYNYDPNERIEYLILDTQKDLQEEEIRFQKRRFLPELSAYYNYNFLFLSPVGSELFDQVYNFSLIGLRLNLPLFIGGQRKFEAKAAALALRNLELEQKNLVLEMNREQQEALSNYKNSYYFLKIQKENQMLAEEIYGTINLQYEEGIKNFLEVIQAETDLRSARINYLRALFGVVQAKLDLQKARGDIKTNY
jgi:outer membrane protein TolC